MERILAVLSGLLLVMWITGVALQGVSERTPKKDLLSWACRRRESPTNVLVSYTSICDEQRAVKYLAILMIIAELGSLIIGAVIWSLIRRRSKWTDEPWRMKA
ncbi:MAG: hypothetical protein LQ352_006143 [Teloschistes flavicans]|nr:MAG: hypothetical protein LQ352_006143 [Teloschistes flavicans]